MIVGLLVEGGGGGEEGKEKLMMGIEIV